MYAIRSYYEITVLGRKLTTNEVDYVSSYYKDPDPLETQDWIASLEGVIEFEGAEKTDYLLQELTDRARSHGVSTSPGILTLV